MSSSMLTVFLILPGSSASIALHPATEPPLAPIETETCHLFSLLVDISTTSLRYSGHLFGCIEGLYITVSLMVFSTF